MTMTSGELLRTARKRKKLSREELSVKMQLEDSYFLSVARLRRIENDETRKRLEDVVRICRALDLPLTELADCCDLRKGEGEK